MVSLFIFIIILIVLWYMIGKPLSQRWGLKRFLEKPASVTNRLRKLVKNKVGIGEETYVAWLEKDNPEELSLRIVGHTVGNDKLRGELAGKLWAACAAIEKVLEMDYSVRTLTSVGHYDLKFLEEMKAQRANHIALADQAFRDIKKTLGS